MSKDDEKREIEYNPLLLARKKLQHNIGLCHKYDFLIVLLNILSIFFGVASITFIALILYLDSVSNMLGIIAIIASAGAVLFQQLLFFLNLSHRLAFHTYYADQWRNMIFLIENQAETKDVVEQCSKLLIEESNMWVKYIV